MFLTNKPLLGNKDGKYKIAIVGNSGTRKVLIAYSPINRAIDFPAYAIGLDPPLMLTSWCVLARTFRRLFLGEQSCAAGCNDSIAETLGSREIILLWCLARHNSI